MALTTENYRVDLVTNQIMPTGTSTWSGQSGKTWSNWREWNYNYSKQVVFYINGIELGLTPKNFTLRINTSSNASISYEVYTSNTGAFAGEETKTVISPNQTGITGFNGAKCKVAVIATATGGMPIIDSITYSYTTVGEKQLSFSQINTAALTGSSSSRILNLNTNVGGITNVNIQPYEVTAYAVDAYVTATPTSTYLIPKVISSTSTSLTFALVGVDNQPRDGIVDIYLQTLPMQYMEGNNLLSN